MPGCCMPGRLQPRRNGRPIHFAEHAGAGAGGCRRRRGCCRRRRRPANSSTRELPLVVAVLVEQHLDRLFPAAAAHAADGAEAGVAVDGAEAGAAEPPAPGSGSGFSRPSGSSPPGLSRFCLVAVDVVGGRHADRHPVALAGDRVLPQLPDAARLDLDELLEPRRQAAEAALEDADRLGVLQAAEDQLLLLLAADGGAPERERGRHHDVEHGDGDDQDDEVVPRLAARRSPVDRLRRRCCFTIRCRRGRPSRCARSRSGRR